MANLKETGKLRTEQDFVEKKLGTLYELTMRLEDKLNAAVIDE